MRILWQARRFPSKHNGTSFVKIHLYLEKL